MDAAPHDAARIEIRVTSVSYTHRLRHNARALERRLWPLNALIALLRGEAGWPKPLGDLGFRLHRVELPVQTDNGTVVIDVVALRDMPGATLACESKSGNNVEPEQALKYKALQAGELRRISSAPSGPLHVLYACSEESVARIRMGLDAAELRASVLSLGGAAIQLFPAPGVEELAFKVPVPDVPPPAYIPIDEASPDGEYQELLLPAVVAKASLALERVSVRSLCEEAFPVVWTHLGSAYSNKIVKRASASLISLSELPELRKFFSVERRGQDLADPVVRILRSPATFRPQGETQGWQAIRRNAEKALRGHVIEPAPAQLSFEDLARQEGVGEDQ